MTATTDERPLLVMSSEYAAAVRLQLEPLARVLEPFDDAAGRAQDSDVLALVARILEATRLAAKIEFDRRPTLAYKGVDLIKH